jgi:hypothetical protein
MRSQPREGDSMSTQSEQEMRWIYEYWENNLAPKGFVTSPENAHIICNEFVRLGSNVMTFERLTEVAKSLGDKLAYEGQPAGEVAPTKDPGFKRGPRPTTRIDVDSERQEFVAAMNDTTSPLFLKLQAEAQLEVQRAIADCVYQNSRGRVDHPLTEQRREVLRSIRVAGKDAKGQDIVLWGPTLQKIQEQKRQFDGDDTRRNEYR